MKSLSIALANGYNLGLNAFEEDRMVDIVTSEPDGTVNQPLVTVRADESGEKLTIDVYSIDEENPIFSVNVPMHHDLDDDMDDLSDDDDDEYDDESDDNDDAELDHDSLSFGDTGEAVKTIQRRLKELGWFNGSIGGNYLSITTEAVKAFQTAAGLHVDGICDAATYDALMSDTAPMKNTVKDNTASSTEAAHGKAQSMDWWTSDIQKIFAKGVTATITDVETGLAWREQRRGGSNHADVQPLTAADTAALKKAYGGKWSWNRRAIFVTINGVNYAASMNGMPHGGSSVSGNNFDGHHCIHFTNSRTHCSNKVCPNHQKAIQKALAATL